MSETSIATVIGGRGFIGSHLVHVLEKSGTPCWVPHREDDLYVRKLGSVFYCAGVSGSQSLPYECARTYVSLPAELLARASFDSFLYVSSTRVYLGAQRGNEMAELRVDPSEATDLFNMMKLAGEAICLGDSRATVRVARVSNVFGKGARRETFLASILRDAVVDGRVTLRTSLDTAKDYISIDDCVRALQAIARQGEHRLYNVASGVNVKHAQIAALLEQRTGATVEVQSGAATQFYPPIDVSRLRQLLPDPPQSVLDALGDLVRPFEETT